MRKRLLSFCLLAVCILEPRALCLLQAAEITLEGQLITDSAGRNVEAGKPFQRIISLYPAHTENLFELGAQDQVAGVSGNENDPPLAKRKPRFSYHDDLEKFLSARPDLILIRPMIDRGYGKLMERLESYGVAVVSLQPSSVDQMVVYWRILGKLTGRPEGAEKMVGRFEESVRRIRSRTTAIQTKKKVYFEAIHDEMRTFSPAAMPIFALETAGGVNIAGDAPPRRGTNIADYGKERILSHADEIDVFLAQVGPMNRPRVETSTSEPGFGLISAVRNKAVYLIDEKLVSRPTLRLLSGICHIGRILYPDIFLKESDALGCFK